MKEHQIVYKISRISPDSMIEITEFPDKTQWNEFVLNHPQGNIFQTQEMAEVYRRTKKYAPVTLAAVRDTGEILAVLQAVLIKELSGFLGFQIRDA